MCVYECIYMYIQFLCTHLNREIKRGVDCVSIFENICGSEKEKKYMEHCKSI